jgi:prophage regulatory protein
MDTLTKLPKPLTLLRREEVKRRTGLSTSGIYKLMAEGRFNRPVRMAGVVAWPEHEVEAFIQQRIAARDAGDTWKPLADAAARVVAKAKPMRRDRGT